MLAGQNNPDGSGFTNVYDTSHRVTTSTVAGRGTVTYFYSADNDVTRTVDELSYSTFYAYSDHLMTQMIDANTKTWTYAYDSARRLTLSVSPSGLSTRTSYTAAGNVSSTTDANGLATTYGTDARNRVTSVAQPHGTLTSATYSEAGLLTSSMNAGSGSEGIGYDARGWVTQTTNADGSITYRYDYSGFVTETVDARGKTVTYQPDAANNTAKAVYLPDTVTLSWEYDKLGQATTAYDGLSHATSLNYDSVGNLTKTTSALGIDTSASYDKLGMLTLSIDGGGNSSSVSFDAAGQVTQTTDANSNSASSEYDKLGRVTLSRDAAGNASTLYYDGDGRLTKSKSPLGLETTFLYDGLRATEIIDPRGLHTTQAYDGSGRVTLSRDAAGNATTFAYDTASRVTRTTYADGTYSTTGYDGRGRVTSTRNRAGNTTSTNYDANGNVTRTTDGNGNATTFAYDDLNRLMKTQTSGGRTESYGYDAGSRRTSWTDAKGKTTLYVYDNDNRMTQSNSPLGNLTNYKYDDSSRVTEMIDSGGYTTTYEFDGVGRLISTTDHTGTSSSTGYDALGRATFTRDMVGSVTNRVFDSDGRLINISDGGGNTTTQAYDADSNLTLVRDASGNETSYAYDNANFKTWMEDPLGATATYENDAVGRVTEQIDRLGRKRTFQYDGVGRLEREVWYNGATPINTLSYGYDGIGSVVSASDAGSAYGVGYDAHNQATAVSGPFGVALTMGYDAVGHRTLLTDNMGGTLSSTYDDDGRLSSLVQTASGTTLGVSYGYDSASRVQYLTRRTNGSVAATTTYGYDGGGRMTSSVTGGINSYAYTYVAGKLTSKTENTVTTTYGYDSAGQLTSDGGTGYTYDATGNRTITGYNTTAGNQLESDGTWNYTYDAEGNMTEKVSSSARWVYEYDHRNRLTSAKEYETVECGPEPLALTAEYKYDAMNNRIEKSVDADGDGEGTAEVERYALEWWNPAKSASPIGMENADVLFDMDGSSSLKTRYLRGDLVDQIYARMDSSGNPYWLLTDRQGSIRDVLDGSGTQKDRIVYDAFGNILSETDDAYRGRYAYTGRELDVETGLQYNRRRYYDSSTGRWISQDPLGFDAGDGNLYRYVNNRIANYNDPSGMQFVNPGVFQKGFVDDVKETIGLILLFPFSMAGCSPGPKAPPLQIKKDVQPMPVAPAPGNGEPLGEEAFIAKYSVTGNKAINAGISYFARNAEGRAFWSEVEKMAGPIDLVLSDRVPASAYVSNKYINKKERGGAIFFNPGSQRFDSSEAIAANLLFELMNAKTSSASDALTESAVAGKMSRIDFVVGKERIEFDNLLLHYQMTKRSAAWGAKTNIFVDYFEPKRFTFDEYLLEAEEHSLLYANYWNSAAAKNWSIVHPGAAPDAPLGIARMLMGDTINAIQLNLKRAK